MSIQHQFTTEFHDSFIIFIPTKCVDIWGCEPAPDGAPEFRNSIGITFWTEISTPETGITFLRIWQFSAKILPRSTWWPVAKTSRILGCLQAYTIFKLPQPRGAILSSSTVCLRGSGCLLQPLASRATWSIWGAQALDLPQFGNPLMAQICTDQHWIRQIHGSNLRPQSPHRWAPCQLACSESCQGTWLARCAFFVAVIGTTAT